MKISFLSKFKWLFSNRFDTFIRKYLEGEEVPSVIGSMVDSNSQMKYSALFGCFRVLAETFASVPVIEYQELPNGDREITNETGLFDILGNIANNEMSAYNFYEAMQYQICAGGNGVAKRLYNTRGDLVGLYPIDYNLVQFERDKNTYELLYKIGNKEILKRKDVFHVPGPSANGVIGMSILEFAAQAIGLGRTYETFGKNFYDNGAIPSGVFEHPTVLKDSAYNRLKEDLDKKYSGASNAGRAMLLEHGLQFKQMTIKPVDAQLLENRRFQVEDICRFCRVPLHMVQELSKSTNNNIEHQSLEFVMYTMLPYFRRWEECINSQLLSPEQRADNYHYEFDMSALLRGDSESMAKSFATGRQWGWLSVNDVRKKLNLNRIENGDIYLQPVNMVEAGTIIGNPEEKELKDDNLDESLDESLDVMQDKVIKTAYANLQRLEKEVK